MLNELWSVAKSSSFTGVDWHDDFQPCRNTAMLIMYLGDDGDIQRLDTFPAETALQIRKWAPNNFSSLPVVNLPGLYRFDPASELMTEARALQKDLADATRVSYEETRQKIQGFIEKTESAWADREEQAFRRSVQDAPQEFLQATGLSLENIGSAVEEEKALLELIQRIQRMGSSEVFRARMLDAFLATLSTDRQMSVNLLTNWILLPLPQKKQPDKQQILFDLPPGKGYYSVTSVQVQDWVNKALLRQESQASLTGRRIADAFGTEASEDEIKDLMPEVRAPILGGIKLRALNEKIPCQNRYRTSGSTTYPVGLTSRKKMKGALQFLLDRTNQGRTWQRLQGLDEYLGAIFCAYTPEDTNVGIELELVRFLVDEDDDDSTVSDEMRFQSTQAIVEALSGKVRDKPYFPVSTFTIVRLDKGRTKLLWPRSFSAKALLDAAEKWQEAGRNLPSMLSLPDNKTSVLGSKLPLPAEVARLINAKWIRSGSSYQLARNASFDDGVELFLSFGGVGRSPASRLLPAVLENFWPLAQEFVSRISRRQAPKVPRGVKADQDRWLIKMPALIGILLQNRGRKVDDYMQTSAYQIGRLLAMADVVHQEYIRRGDKNARLPGSLLGNQYLNRIRLRPVRGMAELTERLRIYQAWATAEGNGLARWALGQIGIYATNIGQQTIPEYFSDEEKAALLLGYLSRSESN